MVLPILPHSPTGEILVNVERLGSVFDVEFTMYEYRLYTNTLNDEKYALLSANLELCWMLTYLHDSPLLMSNTGLSAQDYEVVVQYEPGRM